MLVLRLHEGIAEEQVAACLGLAVERVRALHTRAMATVLSSPARGAVDAPPAPPAPRPAPRPPTGRAGRGGERP